MNNAQQGSQKKNPCCPGHDSLLFRFLLEHLPDEIGVTAQNPFSIEQQSR
jgi:hypothetical protein